MLSSCSSKNEQPDILFIMSDEHCERAIGVYNSRLSELNQTPNMDKFAKEGMNIVKSNWN